VSFSLVTPERPEEAVELLAGAPPGETAVLAGGTDLLFDIDDGRVTPRRVLSLRRLPWRRLEWRDDGLEIGSTLPLSVLESEPEVRVRLPGLWQGVHAVGSLALRHRATLGGNLGRASPASDLFPILLALDARVRAIGPDGSREIPIDEFALASRRTALQPAELIESVRVPRAAASQYLWQRVRPANDISQVGVAVARLRPPDGTRWRVALGGVSPKPQRLPSAESLLVSAAPTEVEVELAAQEAARSAPFVTDKRATETYRRRLVSVLVRRAVRRAIDSGADPEASGS
jgi:carbon-monoxide dehydrogenase medium subunit